MVSKNNKSVNFTIRITKKLRKISSWFLCSVWLIIFISCRSVPGGLHEQTQFIPLESGASVYIIADVKRVQNILDILPLEWLDNSQTRQMVDRTNFAAAALYPQESGRLFQLVSWGRYPSFQAGFVFTFSKYWKKYRSEAGRSFWFSNGLSLALNSRQAFVAASANKEPLDPFVFSSHRLGTEIPYGFNTFSRGAILSCWIGDSAGLVSRIINESGIPIRFPVQQLFINLFSVNDQYEAVIRFQFENASQARGMIAILNLAGGFTSDDPLAALLFANSPVQNGQNIDVKTPPLDEAQLSLLLRMFLLY
jgi:hypothetical protein